MNLEEVSITDGEWEIMESVWQSDDQTPAEILARNDVGNRSHRTLLARLMEKQAVAVPIFQLGENADIEVVKQWDKINELIEVPLDLAVSVPRKSNS